MRSEQQHNIISVAVVDDDGVVRGGLHTLLNNVPALQCVAVYRDVSEAMRGLQEHEPNILLLDVSLPGASGLDSIQPLRERFPQMKIIMHSNYDHEEKILRARFEGAAGYVLKNQGVAALRAAILKVSAGGSAWPAEHEEHYMGKGRASRPGLLHTLAQKLRSAFAK